MTTLEVLNPADGSVLERIPNTSVRECLDAVERARDAQDAWRATAPRVRGELLRRSWELMVRDQERLARLITSENGKVLADARAEVAYAAEFFRWFAEEAVRIDGDLRRSPSGDKWMLVTREPVGVSLLVAPWNFPAAMATRKIGPALAAGCTVVVKPAAECPLTTIAIAELMTEAGVPDGVVNVVTPSPASEAVAAMLDSGHVRKLSFTGSTPVGSLLLARAAERVINCSMELGGNAPFIVCEDADIDAAVDGAMVAKMRNGGAACTAANRFYVHRTVAEEFVTGFTARMSSLRLGNGLHDDVTLGSLVSQKELRRVAGLVDDAVASGARVVCGGAAATDGSCGYEATVLVDVVPGAAILREEIFGPVAPIVVVDDIEESIPLFNGVDHGLVSYLYCGDVGRGMRIANALESGMVGLNRGLVSDPAAPFGGVKASGIGREGAHDGLLEFLETKYIATQW
jgi:succinate-semialdehyde dehydrogenase/glutarate-semialdehyde dehydrogenase